MHAVSVLASPAPPVASLVHRLLATIEHLLARTMGEATDNPVTRESAYAAIARVRDALIGLGYEFDEAARLRLYFLDWSEVVHRREVAERARAVTARRALRERIARLAGADPQHTDAALWAAVAGVRLELSASAALSGAAVLRLHALLLRLEGPLPYLASTPSARGVPLARDPAPAWVLGFSLPLPGGLWAQLRQTIDAHAGLQVRAWDHQDPQAGRAYPPICAEVSDLFHRGGVTPLSAAGALPPDWPVALRGHA